MTDQPDLIPVWRLILGTMSLAGCVLSLALNRQASIFGLMLAFGLSLCGFVLLFLQWYP